MNRSAQVATQSDFYQRNFSVLLKLIYVLVLIAFCMTGVLLYQHFTKPTQQYFITTTDGRLIEIKPGQATSN